MSPLAPLALFGAGIASCLSPCVLPLVPVYLGMLLGSAGEHGARRLIGPTAWFTGGFTAVFAAFGTAAGWLEAAMGDVQWWTVRITGSLVVVLGLMLLVPLPIALTRTFRAVRAAPPVGSVWRPLVLGVAFGAAWTPCAGPLLGAAVLTAASSAGALSGAVLLAAYALGVAAPFVAASLITAWTGTAPAVVTRRLAPAGRALQRLSGVLLLAVGGALAAGWYA
ncbi:MAG TPA: cytochrome c biogenesis CcdA family protein [Kineosporiaceae bacterium]